MNTSPETADESVDVGTIENTDVLIVGAGMAGLSAARTLLDTGCSVLIVDKGKSVGGRLATRRIGNGAADHGAQYFTARDEDFQRQVDTWIEEDLVFLWAMGFNTGSLTANESFGNPRYAVRGGMNKLAKSMASELSERGATILPGVRVASIALQEKSSSDAKTARERESNARPWRVRTQDGRSFAATALILTAPVPQSLELIDQGGVELSQQDRDDLESIHYSPCIAGMFRYEGTLEIPQSGAVQRPAHTIPWIADNQQKGISPDEHLITLHADADYSRRYWDAPEIEIVETMRAYMEPFLTPESRLLETQIKRWRYSYPEKIHPERRLLAANLPTLVFAGDAFGGPRVEGAYLSGQAAGRTVAAALQPSDQE